MASAEFLSDADMATLEKAGVAKDPNFISDEDMAKMEASGEAQGLPSELATGVRSAAEGMTAGISEPIISEVKARELAAKQAVEEGLQPGSPKYGPNPAYERRVEELATKFVEQDVAARRAAKDAYPMADIGGQIAGAVIPSPLNVGAKIGQAAVKTFGAAKNAGTLAKIGRGAAVGAADAIGYQAVRQAALRPTGFVKEGEEPSLTEAGKIGSIIGGSLPVGRLLAKGAGYAGRKAFNLVFRVNDEAVEAVTKYGKELRKAPTQDEIAKVADDAVEHIKKIAADEGANLKTQIMVAADDLGQKVSQESSVSYRILEDASDKVEKAKINKAKILGFFDDKIKNLKRQQGLVGPDKDVALRDLNKYRADLDASLPSITSLDGPTIKNVIRSVQNYTDGAYATFGKYDSLQEQVFKDIRRNIDQGLKRAVPEYAEQMEKVAALTQLRKRVVKELGTEKQAEKAVEALNKGYKDHETLAKLSAEANLPIDRVAQVKANADMFKGFDSMNMEDKVKTLIGGRSEKTKKLFRELGSLSDKDFLLMAEKAKANHRLNTEILGASSRNVNFFALLGFIGAGAAAGPGLIIGAAVGYVLDRYGPQMARKILEEVGTIKGMPTVQKISRLSLPPKIKEELAGDLIRSYLITEQNRPVEIPVESVPQMKQEVYYSDALSNEEKAEEIDSLNRRGEMNHVKKLMGGSKQNNIKVEKPKPMKPQAPAVSVKGMADVIRNKRQAPY